MYHPFQKIASIKPGNETFLLAAAGPLLLITSLKDGTIASRWSASDQGTSADSSISNENGADQHRPNKRRKVEIPQTNANIIDLAPTADSQHVVVITGEDKCVRVFSIDPSGRLRLVNERCMSKRPSAVTLIDNDSSIICADKFGDVYALPLLPTEEQEIVARQAARQNTRSLRVMATETTVHSKANLKSLEFQRKQANGKAPVKTKETMEFAHDFLLGHVSMITDVVATQISMQNAESGRKTYVLTSDRDEHIRISRGPPQSYVIERYCLGHKEYINKLCVVAPDTLVSGGGDDDLFVWDLRDGSLLSRIPLLPILAEASGVATENLSIDVSGLWTFPSTEENKAVLLVALEGQPFLFYTPISNLRTSSRVEVLPLVGNLLDLAIVEGLVVASLDNIHAPGSTRDIHDDTASKSRLQVIDILDTKISLYHELQARLIEVNETLTMEWHEKQLQTLLYSTGVLRKHRGEQAEDDLIEDVVLE